MEITLKKFKHHPDMSEETEAFTADVYVDAKLVCTAKNDGQGGCTCLYPIERNLFNKVEMDLKSLGKKDLESEVDNLVWVAIMEKEIKKGLRRIDKAAENNLLIVDAEALEKFKKTGDQFSYKKIATKKSPRLFTEDEKEHAKKQIKLNDGEFIYNTGWH